MNRFSFFGAAIELRALKSNGIERLHQQFGNYHSREHGKDDTKSQGRRKALDGTGAQKPQHCRGNQSRDISVHNRRGGLFEADVNSRLDRLTLGYLLLNPCKNNDIGIHRHTDGKNNTRNTGQRQSNLKGIQQNNDKLYIKSKSQTGHHA